MPTELIFIDDNQFPVRKEYLYKITPHALANTAELYGWEKSEPYGTHWHAYEKENAYELIIPNEDESPDTLTDYASTTAEVILIITHEAERMAAQKIIDKFNGLTVWEQVCKASNVKPEHTYLVYEY